VAGAVLRQQHRSTKPEKKNRLEMFVQMGTTLSRINGITLGCVFYQKTSGLPIVGDSKNYIRQ
jgi:hypothetical protein